LGETWSALDRPAVVVVALLRFSASRVYPDAVGAPLAMQRASSSWGRRLRLMPAEGSPRLSLCPLRLGGEPQPSSHRPGTPSSRFTDATTFPERRSRETLLHPRACAMQITWRIKYKGTRNVGIKLNGSTVIAAIGTRCGWINPAV